ncbi:MAG: AarF/ABC1/UbiB kinase family protein [Deltaproteobacteria bacterium]|nr:AarF/ABC1/UbiB kinase family protein [Deltaproteobacteria bacterium]
MPEKSKPVRITKGRTKRALQVGSLTTSVGGSYVWNALKRPFQSADQQDQSLFDLHLKNALRIVESSRELRGAFIKLVQMLSMRDDLLPLEVLNVLSVVQSSVPPMEYALIREQVKNELGKYPEQLFKRFEHEAFAAASLGQVHRATLKNGDDVVVKVQYPGVDETVVQDLKNLKALLHAFTRLTRDVLRQKSFDASEIYQEMEERLREELDYVHEANNLALFQRLFADDDEVLIPRVYPDMSSRRVLTMEYLDGYKLQDILAPGVEQTLKDWVSIKYFQMTWRQILEFGVLHTDPHPGNYLVTYHPKVAMLDFGSVRVFPEEIRKGYLTLAKAILDRDEPTMARCFDTLGYIDPGVDPSPLVKIMYLIFEPVLEDRDYDPHEFDSAKKTMEITSIGIENRIFNAPGHRLFLVRALWGLDSYTHQFRTITNWHRIFRKCVEGVKG